MTPARSRLLLGVDTDVPISIEVVGADAASFNVSRLLATVGSIDPPRPGRQPGSFLTRYVPPVDRFPQVALLVVELASGARRVHAVARIALEGSTTVPFHTAPGVSVTMRVGDRLFGPAIGDRQGHVEIPIRVPPGVHSGIARAVERDNPARETEVDLQLPSFPRVLILAPDTVEAGSFAEIPVLAVNPDGSPTLARDVNLTASAGIVHPLGPGLPAETRFVYEAPRRIRSGAVALTAVAAGRPPSRADVAVPLHPGPPFAVTIRPNLYRLTVASDEVATVAIAAFDLFGNPLPPTGIRADVDGAPRTPEILPGRSDAVLTVAAPQASSGRDRITVSAALGSLTRTQAIRLTGGPPTRLTLEVRDGRLIADGRRSTELRVRAVDRNGTPTSVPGLGWRTPDGRVRNVRVPREGEYLADYVPDRTPEPQRQQLTVMASSALRAEATLDVVPPPVRALVAARAGILYNLGQSVGPAAFLEALAPLPFRVRRLPLYAGLSIGYVHTDIEGRGVGATGAAHLDADQLPILAVLRARWPISTRVDLSVDGAAGASWADTLLTISGAGVPTTSIRGHARAPALATGFEASVRLKPGRLLLGARYLWIDLGRTSQGDDITGNSAGLLGDIGYRLAF